MSSLFQQLVARGREHFGNARRGHERGNIRRRLCLSVSRRRRRRRRMAHVRAVWRASECPGLPLRNKLPPKVSNVLASVTRPWKSQPKNNKRRAFGEQEASTKWKDQVFGRECNRWKSPLIALAAATGAAPSRPASRQESARKNWRTEGPLNFSPRYATHTERERARPPPAPFSSPGWRASADRASH